MTTEDKEKIFNPTTVLANYIYSLTEGKHCYYFTLQDDYPGSLRNLLSLSKRDYDEVLSQLNLNNTQRNDVRMASLQQLVEILSDMGLQCSFKDGRQRVHSTKCINKTVTMIKLGSVDLPSDLLFYKDPPTEQHKRSIQEVKEQYITFFDKFSTLRDKSNLRIGESVKSPTEKEDTFENTCEEMLLEDIGKIFNIHHKKIRNKKNKKKICDAVAKYLRRLLGTLHSKESEKPYDKSKGESGSNTTSNPLKTNDCDVELHVTTENTVDEGVDREPIIECMNLHIRQAFIEYVDQYLMGRVRVTIIYRWNGRDTKIVSCPHTLTKDTFIRHAKRVHWVDQLLTTHEMRLGMVTYLFQHYPELKGDELVKEIGITAPTSFSCAITEYANLGRNQFDKIRTILYRMFNFRMIVSQAVLDKIDAQSGWSDNFKMQTGEYIHERKKKDAENCQFYFLDIKKEISSEIDMYIYVKNEDGETDDLSLSYNAPSNKDGITILFGGDHGKGAFRMHTKVHLTSPQERKERKQLSFHCPILQIAYVKCGKDNYKLLMETIMKELSAQIKEIQKACTILVHDRNPKTGKMEHWKSYLVPRTSNINNLRIDENNKIRIDDNCTIDLNKEKRFEGADFKSFKVEVIVNNFYDFYIGDLAFLAMLLGMPNAETKHCILCELLFHGFNCGKEITMSKLRTLEKLNKCLIEWDIHKHKSNCNNIHGVNSKRLLPLEPGQVIIAQLHCPMGLIDKWEQHMMEWIELNCMVIPSDIWDLRIELTSALAMKPFFSKEIQEAKKNLFDAKERMKDFQENHPNQYDDEIVENDRQRDIQSIENEIKEAESHLDERKDSFKQYETRLKSQKSEFQDRIKPLKQKGNSVHFEIEKIFADYHIKKEVYHGGKFNGVSCIRIMENADDLMKDISDLLKRKRDEHDMHYASDETIEGKCNTYALLLNSLAAIWSQVRGVEKGLLPTEENKRELSEAIAKGRKIWLDLGITTNQPKWHLTFDGHLEEQYDQFSGIADKAEDAIEFEHQTWHKLDVRYRHVKNFTKKHSYSHKARRRSKHPVVSKLLTTFMEKSNRHYVTPKTKRKRMKKALEKRETKMIKREPFYSDQALVLDGNACSFLG